MRFATRFVTIGLIAAAIVRPVAVSALDEPKPATSTPKPAEAPIPIILNAPVDRESFWKMLGRPDQVLLDGQPNPRPKQGSEPAAKPQGVPILAVVESLAATGEVAGDWARLTVEYRVAVETDGPEWVAIHLDGLALSGVREGARELPTRMAEGRAWQVELQGKGEHPIRVELFAPVRSTAEGRRLDLAIPPVASTRFDLIVPQTVLDADTGASEPVAVKPVEGGPWVRLAARLSPRSRIELTWRERADPALTPPALLSTRGELAVEVDRDSIRTRSSWLVAALRGSVNQLTIRLDPAEEVLDVEVDGQPVLVEARREGGRSALSIPLAEPLRTGSSRGVTLTTRRALASVGTARVALQGYSFDHAKAQTGRIAIARVGPLFLDPTPGRGLRRIDPKTQLPDPLRNRADPVLAFEFNEQPFELGLGIEPAPPRLRVEGRTTIVLDPRSARLQATLDCRASQGRPFEVQVILPRGLDFEAAGPPDVVEWTRAVPLDPKADAQAGADVPRVLSIGLTPRARESDGFTIVLKGRCEIDPSRAVALSLFQPVAGAMGGHFAVVTDRNISVDLISTVDDPPIFRGDWGSPPDDWPWPTRRPGPDQGLLWLRSDANPESLPLRAGVRPRSIRHESTLTASIDDRGADVVDEVSGEVAFGNLSRLDIALPGEVGDHWEVEGVERTAREPLEVEPDGSRRFRLRFARDLVDTLRLRIRYRLPFAKAPANDREGRLRLAPVRVLEGTSTGHRVLISAEPGIEVATDAKGWSATAPGDLPAASEGGSPVKVALSRADEKAGPIEVAVRFGPRLPLPGVVVSRLWIRTVQRAENDLATTASFLVEAREGAMVVGLDAGSRWVRARVGSVELGEGGIEVLAPGEYRLRFPPSTPSGPVLVSIDYEVPASATSGGWPAPRLLAGGVVQQTAWEVQVLGNRAGIGTPSGWIDENEWAWDGLLWRRRPWKTEAEMVGWLNGGNPRVRLADPAPAVEPAGHIRYLFSRAGPPTPLRFAVFSRPGLLLLCSGPALVIGLLVLFRRPPPRWVAASLLVLGFAAGAFVELNVLLLILQSSALGIALFVMALAMHWAIERRGRARPVGDRALIVGPSTIGSSVGRASPVGSEESTSIRVRPVTPSMGSTTDHIVMTRTPARPLDGRSLPDGESR